MFLGIPSLLRGRPTVNPQLGLFSLSGSALPPTDTVLNNPNVDGISIGEDWADLELADGVYDWSFYDTQIARITAAGKKILLRVATGAGDATRGNNGKIPGWVIAQITASVGGTPNDCDHYFHFDDNGHDRAMPTFWEPIFVQKRRELYTAMGARYGSNSNIKVVHVGVANARTNDWNVADSATVDDICGVGKSERSRWLDLGFTAQKLIDSACPAAPATGGVLDAVAAAFPGAYICFSSGNMSSSPDAPSMNGLDPSDYYSITQMFNNAKNKYSLRALMTIESLCQRTHENQPYSGQPAGNQWTILFNNPPCAAQMTGAVSNPQGLARMSGVANGGAVQVLTESIDEGALYHTLFQEVYAADFDNPALVDVIAHGHTLLTRPW